jgi:hypothetical protein
LKVSLWQLNESYQALVRLTSKELPKEQHKLAYKLSRVMKCAKSEMETLGDSLNDLMRKCGFVQGQQDVAAEKIDDFNQQSKKFMRETQAAEIWGDPIRWSEICDHVSISPLDLALLDWLIVEEAAESSQAEKRLDAVA